LLGSPLYDEAEHLEGKRDNERDERAKRERREREKEREKRERVKREREGGRERKYK